ncbi:HNH endonuclease [Treponema berlinense]|uniref:HNH endonuclease n=1 Tax=Treponema berlinense TaxID=225004 RepID=A0A1T4KM94_9SPIR|nr:HNH endonuclease [Treponema berlinense]SJZ43524.1 HNH endonuclease [Treponema berlinense]
MTGWKQYHSLSKKEIELLKKELFNNKPETQYPHYKPIKTNSNDNSYEKLELAPNLIIEVNKFGAVRYKGKILKQYATGSFMHVAMIYFEEYGNVPVYELVKRAFDPIDNREHYEIHHINNNALDNRLENLIYVTRQEHRLIDEDFNKKVLIPISKKITQNNRKDLINYFNNNSERSINGSELLKVFNNTSFERIKYNIDKLCKDKNIMRIENNDLFIFQKFLLNESR